MINRIMLGKETVENVGWMELGKQENPEKNSKDPDFPHHNWPLSAPRIELETLVGTDSGLTTSTPGRLPLKFPILVITFFWD